LFAGALLAAALLAYLRFRAGQRAGFGLALGCYALALGCYEAAVVFPTWLVAYDHLFLGRRSGRSHRALVRGWLPFVALSALYLGWRQQVFGVLLGGYAATGERLARPQLGALARDLVITLERLWLPVFAPPAGDEGSLAALLARVVDVGSNDPRRSAAVVVALVGLPLLLAAVRRPARWLSGWVFGWVVALSGLAPFAFAPMVPASGRYCYLAALGVAFAFGAFAAGLAGALPRRGPTLALAATAVVATFSALLLAGHLRATREAAEMAARVGRELARVAAAAPGKALFLSGHPAFLTDPAGTPLAQVHHYGLRDAAGPPFQSPALAVYPLPPLSAEELLPVATAAGALALQWDAAAQRVRRVTPEPAPGLAVFEPVALPAARPRRPAGHRYDVRLAVRVPAGRHASFRLLLAAPINGVVVPVDHRPGPGGVLRVRVPGELVEAVAELYGGETIWWWVEGRDAGGRLSGVSPLRAVPLPAAP
jgi:hypothetical protein